MSHDIKPLWLVQPRLDASEYRDKLIGSVVKYPNLPTERHIPYRTDKLPLEMVTDLDPKPVRVRNVAFWKRRIKDAGVEASVNDILNIFAERAKADNSEKVATVARVWHMDAPGKKFKDLLKHQQYFEELFDLLRSNHDQGYFVTDVITLANLEMSDWTERSGGAGASAQVPIDPSFGVDVGGGANFNVLREQGHSVTYEEETIVFLGYRLVRLEKVSGMRAKMGRVFLGKKHGFAVHDGFDYWPEMVEKPVPGNAENFMAAMTPATEEPPEPELMACDDIADELGFDVEIVG